MRPAVPAAAAAAASLTTVRSYDELPQLTSIGGRIGSVRTLNIRRTNKWLKSRRKTVLPDRSIEFFSWRQYEPPPLNAGSLGPLEYTPQTAPRSYEELHSLA